MKSYVREFRFAFQQMCSASFTLHKNCLPACSRNLIGQYYSSVSATKIVSLAHRFLIHMQRLSPRCQRWMCVLLPVEWRLMLEHVLQRDPHVRRPLFRLQVTSALPRPCRERGDT